MATPQPHEITLSLSQDERDLVFRALSELRTHEQGRADNYRRQKLTVFAEQCLREVGVIDGLTDKLAVAPASAKAT